MQREHRVQSGTEVYARNQTPLTVIREALVLVLALFMCVSSVAQQKVSYQRDYRYLVDRIDGIFIPKDIDEAVDSLDTMISPE